MDAQVNMGWRGKKEIISQTLAYYKKYYIPLRSMSTLPSPPLLTTHLFTPSLPDLTSASSLLHQDQLVAFPTETVYGLGGSKKKERQTQCCVCM